MVRDGPILHKSQRSHDTNYTKVIFLLLSDGIMCACTAVTWLIQRLVSANYLNWDRTGWIVQNVSSKTPFLTVHCTEKTYSDMANCIHRGRYWPDALA
jgi:hypothetical protein